MMNTWMNHFSDTILKRGLNYYHSNAVKIIQASSSSVDAEVTGSTVYNVRINLKTQSMYCNCPYNGNCKHLAATLYYIEDHPDILTDKNYDNLLLSLTYDELVEFLSTEISRNSDLAEKLKMFKLGPNPDYYQNKLKDSFSETFKVFKFIDDDLYDLKEQKDIDLILVLLKTIVEYAEFLDLEGQYDDYEVLLDKIEDLVNQLIADGFKNQVCEFLAEFILNSKDECICDLFEYIYSKYRNTDELWS